MTRSAAAARARGTRHDNVGWRAPGTALTTILLGIVLLGGADLLSPAAARAAVPPQVGPCVAGWQEVPVPDDAFIASPFEVLTHDGEPAWILGGDNSGLLALRWSASGWKRIDSGTHGHRGLVGGSVSGDGTVLGVGYYRPFGGDGDGSLLPIGGQIAKSTWKARAIADPPGARATLTDVVDLGADTLAVGTRLDGGQLHAFAGRWHGSRWSRQEPDVPGRGSGLVAVDRAPSGAIWAVGWQEPSPGQPRPYIARRTASGWRSVRSAALPRGRAVLTDVEFRTGGDGWAVGYLAAKGSDRHIVILEHWDGTRWSRRPLPWAQEVAALPRSVSVAEGGKLWIAGAQVANDQREARGFIAHFDGAAWRVDVLGVPAELRSEVMDVAATTSGAVAVASVAASLLVLRSCQDAAAPAQATRVHRIKVGNLKARRRTRTDEAHLAAPYGGGAGRGVAGTSIAGGGPTKLPPPVAPIGFAVQDMAPATGLAEWTLTFGGLAADFDGNGYPDVFFSRHGEQRPRLAMNGGPTGFVDAPGTAFSVVDRHRCDSADVDADGSLDILCAVGAARGKTIGRHELSLAPDKPTAALVTGTRGISDSLGRGRDVAFIRLDGDPYPEVYIVDAPDRDDGLPAHNRFYRNVGGNFVPAPGAGLDTSEGGECLEAGDMDQDGDEDLVHCTSYGLAGRPAGLRFLSNVRGKLKDRTAALGIEPIADVGAAFADVSGDGRLDLVQLSRGFLRVSHWANRGYRPIFEARLLGGVAIAVGDADGDGLADIYVLRGDGSKNRADVLLLSQDGGRAFVSVAIPQTRRGSADDVIALDYDGNGLTDFVVLNGRKKAGPVQLLASFPVAPPA